MADTRVTTLSTQTMLNKVPEVTFWFWLIKILCTTVGESFADWINTSLGVGLGNTALIFTAVLTAVLYWQFRLRRYEPFVYWLTVVVVSVTGTLYTDLLTDSLGVPLALSTAVFSVVLAVVFGLWYAKERTLSIHSIRTTPREAFYWLAVLVTFALGTAVGDWTLELTGWGPGTAVLLPAALIAAVYVGWRCGANAVLSFWLAYILTRPLGANLGDWFASPKSEGGLGLGTAVTSILFLAAILATVAYLRLTHVDVIEEWEKTHGKEHIPTPKQRRRERLMLAYYGVVAVAAVSVLTWANNKPHTQPVSEGESGPVVTQNLTPAQVTAHFPSEQLVTLRAIVNDGLTTVRTGDQKGALKAASSLEKTWDADQTTLQPLNGDGWTYLDGRIDTVLNAIRAAHPDAAVEQSSLATLKTALG
jgi:uncharacterized membrane-anchored protein